MAFSDAFSVVAFFFVFGPFLQLSTRKQCLNGAMIDPGSPASISFEKLRRALIQHRFPIPLSADTTSGNLIFPFRMVDTCIATFP